LQREQKNSYAKKMLVGGNQVKNKRDAMPFIPSKFKQIKNKKTKGVSHAEITGTNEG